MIKEINRNSEFLQLKSIEATKEDKQVALDLIDTLKANEYRCVGMAANMIGVNKRIIVVLINNAFIPMINPVIKRHSLSSYEAEEGCLSHDGTRKTTRYTSIELEYRDINFRKKKQNYTGFTAQIIQHELDHLEGILI